MLHSFMQNMIIILLELSCNHDNIEAQKAPFALFFLFLINLIYIEFTTRYIEFIAQYIENSICDPSTRNESHVGSIHVEKMGNMLGEG